MTLQRYKSQIAAQILVVCQGVGISKTQIVRRVNLNTKTADFYLDLLAKRGILEGSRDHNLITYKTTTKGEMVMASLKAIEECYF